MRLWRPVEWRVGQRIDSDGLLNHRALAEYIIRARTFVGWRRVGAAPFGFKGAGSSSLLNLRSLCAILSSGITGEVISISSLLAVIGGVPFSERDKHATDS
jgi:hypothetical protein